MEEAQKKKEKQKIPTKKGTIIRILIVFLVAGLSWHFSSKIWKRSSFDKEPPRLPKIEIPSTEVPSLTFPLPEEVLVFTDKNRYANGETIRISFENKLLNSIWYFPGCAGNPFWNLEKYNEKKGQWILVYFTLPRESNNNSSQECRIVACEKPEPKELKTGEKIDFSFELKTFCFWPIKPIGVPKITPKPLEQGTYRVVFNHYLEFPSEETDDFAAYSNEFEILNPEENNQ